MITHPEGGAKRVDQKGVACRVHKGYLRLYRAIHKSIDDNGDDRLTTGVPAPAVSEPSPPSRPDRGTSEPLGYPAGTFGIMKGQKMINRRCVSSAYPETGPTQYTTRKMGAHEHALSTPCDLRITIRAHRSGETW